MFYCVEDMTSCDWEIVTKQLLGVSVASHGRLGDLCTMIMHYSVSAHSPAEGKQPTNTLGQIFTAHLAQQFINHWDLLARHSTRPSVTSNLEVLSMYLSTKPTIFTCVYVSLTLVFLPRVFQHSSLLPARNSIHHFITFSFVFHSLCMIWSE